MLTEASMPMNGRVTVFFLLVKHFSYPSSNITGTSSVKIRNLLLAREALLLSFIEYYRNKFGKDPQIKSINHIAYIISWNVWQMDGLKGVVPDSCGERVRMEPSLFGTIERREPCEGCLKNDLTKHNGIYCIIKDWRTTDKATGKKGKRIRFIDLINEEA